MEDEMTGLRNRPSEDIAEIVFDLVSEHASDDDIAYISRALRELKDRGTIRNQPVAGIWADAMREAVQYRTDD